MAKLVMLLTLLAALVPSYCAESLEKGGEEPEPLAYKQWVAFHITYVGHGSLRVVNARLDWGKWYDHPNQDKELGTVNGVEIKSGGPAGTVAASGRENSPSGTEGTFELYQVEGAKKLVEIYFDCPWSGKNKISKKTFSDDVIVDISDWSTSGALGNINVKVANLGTRIQQEA